MTKEKKLALHFLAVTALVIFIVLGVASTSTPNVKNDFSYPQSGISNNANIAVKDFKTVGIIFVNSTEVLDSTGSHTGSKITHEMFMREAVKLGADDVINIKIDVNQKVDRETKNTTTKTVTTYTYTGTGLAIKYADAISGISSNGTSNINGATTPILDSNLLKNIKK